MDNSARIQLAHCLHERQGSTAETWYTAIARTSFAPFSPVELRQRLFELAGQAIELLLTEPFEPDRAAQIGVSLAGLHYTQPEALGRTQGVLARELLAGLSAEQVVALGPNMAALLEGVAIGFARQCTSTLLLEQESIRRALVSELRAAQRELREARDHLEELVEQRTEELRASEERLRDLLEKIDAVVASVDQTGMITYTSPPLARLFGLHPSEVVGRPFHELVYAEDLPRILEQIGRASADRGDASEFRFTTGWGELRWVRASIRPVFADGEMIAAHAVLTDVTERRRAEEALQESEARWQSLVTDAPDLICILDAQGRILFVNHIPADSTFTSEDVLGRHPYDLAVPEDRETVRSAVEHVFATGTSTGYEAAVRRANGAIVWYAVRMGPLWHDGRVVSGMMIARNITEHKRSEEMKDNLLRDVSHELRTPLARIQISLELLLERVERNPIDQEAAVKYGRVALGNVQRLAQTVEVILDLSRLEAGVGGFARETIQLAGLIGAAIGDMEPLASDKGLTLMADVVENLPPVQGDREKLSRVLHNLIDNAIKFSSSGTIVVSASRRQEKIEVSVSDEGCGILPDNLDRVFDRFYRESTENPGVGVGLPMCKTIVEAHNGRIWAESAGKGRGATLRFTLPTLRDAGEPPGDPEKAEDHEQ